MCHFQTEALKNPFFQGSSFFLCIGGYGKKHCAEMDEPTDQGGLECFVIAWRRAATEIDLVANWTLHEKKQTWLC